MFENLILGQIIANFKENFCANFSEHSSFELNQIHGSISKQTKNERLFKNNVFIFMHFLSFVRKCHDKREFAKIDHKMANFQC